MPIRVPAHPTMSPGLAPSLTYMQRRHGHFGFIRTPYVPKLKKEKGKKMKKHHHLLRAAAAKMLGT